jgi:hypothetical protein
MPRPTMSVVRRGPVGCLQPSTMALSMSSALAMPSSTIRGASRAMATARREEAKPGGVFDDHGGRAQSVDPAPARSTSSGCVCLQMTTSTRMPICLRCASWFGGTRSQLPGVFEKVIGMRTPWIGAQGRSN